MAAAASIPSRIRILIADDHQMFAEALTALLEKNCKVVGLVRDGRELIQRAIEERPDVIIVDIAMPLLNGLDAAQKIRRDLPNMKIIFLTMQEDPNLAAAAMELGPVGFVLKHSAQKELFTALGRVLHNEAYITPKLKSEDWQERAARARQFSKELSPRQREIVQMCAEGRTLKEIAAVLNLSEKTVEFHKYHVMSAFNLKSNADLVLFALKHNLIKINSDPWPATGAPNSSYKRAHAFGC